MSAGKRRNDLAGSECSPGEQTYPPVDGAGVSRETPDESANGEVEHPLPEGVFHLISAHEVAPNLHHYPTYVALCGEKAKTSSLAETDCPNECECEFSGTMAYCPTCLRAAIEQNRRAGVDTGDGSMVTAPG